MIMNQYAQGLSGSPQWQLPAPWMQPGVFVAPGVDHQFLPQQAPVHAPLAYCHRGTHSTLERFPPYPFSSVRYPLFYPPEPHF